MSGIEGSGAYVTGPSFPTRRLGGLGTWPLSEAPERMVVETGHKSQRGIRASLAGRALWIPFVHVCTPRYVVLTCCFFLSAVQRMYWNGMYFEDCGVPITLHMLTQFTTFSLKERV